MYNPGVGTELPTCTCAENPPHCEAASQLQVFHLFSKLKNLQLPILNKHTALFPLLLYHRGSLWVGQVRRWLRIKYLFSEAISILVLADALLPALTFPAHSIHFLEDAIQLNIPTYFHEDIMVWQMFQKTWIIQLDTCKNYLLWFLIKFSKFKFLSFIYLILSYLNAIRQIWTATILKTKKVTQHYSCAPHLTFKETKSLPIPSTSVNTYILFLHVILALWRGANIYFLVMERIVNTKFLHYHCRDCLQLQRFIMNSWNFSRLWFFMHIPPHNIH